MENDNQTPEVELDENQIDEEVESDEVESTEQEVEQTDWKAEALKYKAILDRNKNKKPTEQKVNKSNDLDYGQKAFLTAKGIDTDNKGELGLVKNIMQDTGKSLEDVLSSKYFQAELKEMRDLKASSNAIPNGKRSGTASQDSVDYWIAKGELPPASDRELRQKVVNARIKKNDNKGVFYNN